MQMESSIYFLDFIASYKNMKHHLEVKAYSSLDEQLQGTDVLVVGWQLHSLQAIACIVAPAPDPCVCVCEDGNIKNPSLCA